MRHLIALAAVTAGLFSLAGPVPAQTSDQTSDQVLTARKCVVVIRNRVAGGKRHCTELTLRRDISKGRTEVLIDFPDGFCRRDIGWRAVARKA